MDVYIQVFLTSAVVGCERSALRPGRFKPLEKSPDIPLIGGWVGPGIRLDDVERTIVLALQGFELRLFNRRARSQSLYGLC
jgi:hypothetical protein